jgi:hypothetical protein
MLSDEGHVYFEYSPSRGAAVATQLLGGITAVVQTDWYCGYVKVCKEPGITRASCLDHVRRRFVKVQESAPKECAKILSLMQKLYAVERDGKKLLAEERVKLREKKSKPVVDELRKLLDALALSSLPKSALGEAVSYALKQWPELTVFLGNGRVELSNIGIEQQIRPIALGRNNWLFAGSERGAKWAGVMYSLLGTCKLNRINPYEYLEDILRRAPTLPRSEIEKQLTPHAWKAARHA